MVKFFQRLFKKDPNAANMRQVRKYMRALESCNREFKHGSLEGARHYYWELKKIRYNVNDATLAEIEAQVETRDRALVELHG